MNPDPPAGGARKATRAARRGSTRRQAARGWWLDYWYRRGGREIWRAALEAQILWGSLGVVLFIFLALD